MNTRTPMMKQRNAAAAHGSVLAEGLSPSKQTKLKMQQYMTGKSQNGPYDTRW